MRFILRNSGVAMIAALLLVVCVLQGYGAAQSEEGIHTIAFKDDLFVNVVLRLRAQFAVRLCYEEQAPRESDFQSLADEVRDNLTQAQAQRVLNDYEKSRLRPVTESHDRGMPAEKLILTSRGYCISGEFSGKTIEELLDKTTAGSPYTWFMSNGTYVILPRVGSRLTFPVSVDIDEGTTLEDAVYMILAKDPVAPATGKGVRAGSELRSKDGAPREVPATERPVARLTLKNVTAVEALCRAVEAAGPDCDWTVLAAGMPDTEWPPRLVAGVSLVPRANE